MSHCVKGFRRLRERFVLWLLSFVERCMFSVLPRGPLRRRMRDRIDSALRRRHFATCGRPQQSRDPASSSCYRSDC
jgi:hypothetical protein